MEMEIKQAVLCGGWYAGVVVAVVNKGTNSGSGKSNPSAVCLLQTQIIARGIIIGSGGTKTWGHSQQMFRREVVFVFCGSYACSR
jgi:hypothetical protein